MISFTVTIVYHADYYNTVTKNREFKIFLNFFETPDDSDVQSVGYYLNNSLDRPDVGKRMVYRKISVVHTGQLGQGAERDRSAD